MSSAIALLVAWLALDPTTPAGAPPEHPREIAMVRHVGRVRPLDVTHGVEERAHVRALARTVLQSARPQLRACANLAFERKHTEFVRTAVELELTRDGRVVAARVVGDPVVDTAGDRCVAAMLERVRIADVQLDRSIRVRVRLLFSWQGARHIDERTGVPAQSPFPTDYSPHVRPIRYASPIPLTRGRIH